MEYLVSSFREHLGLRGIHVYSNEECKFLPWGEVISLIRRLPGDTDPEFSDRLLETLANYDPDSQFLALQQLENTVSIELYAKQSNFE